MSALGNFGKLSHYPVGADFFRLLCWHMETGTRHDGEPDMWGEPWDEDAMSEAICALKGTIRGVSSDAVLTWTRDGKRPYPRNFQSIAVVFFGRNPAYLRWKSEFTSAYNDLPAQPNRKDITARRKVPHSANTMATVRPEVSSELRSLVPAVVAELGIRRELLEVLAMRFGHEAPDNPDVELIEFLKSKAKEYHDLKGRIAKLCEKDAHFQNLLGAAQDALDGGKFKEASELLLSAEESYQSSKTMEALWGQYEIRVTRGLAVLLGGNLNECAEIFEKSVTIFSNFDEFSEAKCRVDLACLIVERSPWTDYGCRYFKAFELIEPSLSVFGEDTHEWAISHYHAAKIICCGRGSFFDIQKPNALKYLKYLIDFRKNQLMEEDISIALEHICYSSVDLGNQSLGNGNKIAALGLFHEASNYGLKAIRDLNPVSNPKIWIGLVFKICQAMINISRESSGLWRLQNISDLMGILEKAYLHRDLEERWIVWIYLWGYYFDAAEIMMEMVPQHKRDNLMKNAELIREIESNFILNNLKYDVYQRDISDSESEYDITNPWQCSSGRKFSEFEVFYEPRFLHLKEMYEEIKESGRI